MMGLHARLRPRAGYSPAAITPAAVAEAVRIRRSLVFPIYLCGLSIGTAAHSGARICLPASPVEAQPSTAAERAARLGAEAEQASRSQVEAGPDVLALAAEPRAADSAEEQPDEQQPAWAEQFSQQQAAEQASRSPVEAGPDALERPDVLALAAEPRVSAEEQRDEQQPAWAEQFSQQQAAELRAAAGREDVLAPAAGMIAAQGGMQVAVPGARTTTVRACLATTLAEYSERHQPDSFGKAERPSGLSHLTAIAERRAPLAMAARFAVCSAVARLEGCRRLESLQAW
jgi:hypothetical protein